MPSSKLNRQGRFFVAYPLSAIRNTIYEIRNTKYELASCLRLVYYIIFAS